MFFILTLSLNYQDKLKAQNQEQKSVDERGDDKTTDGTKNDRLR